MRRLSLHFGNCRADQLCLPTAILLHRRATLASHRCSPPTTCPSIARYEASRAGSLRRTRRAHYQGALRIAEPSRTRKKILTDNVGCAGCRSAILIVVQDGERNAFDQRWLEYELLEQCVAVQHAVSAYLHLDWADQLARSVRHGVSSHRSSLKTLASAASQSRSSDLIFTPPYSSESVPISVVYYRAAYTPDDYHSPADWQTRTRLESSTAIMCPGYSLQLAGSKKVQQVLATPGVLEYFLPTASSTARRSKRSPAACRGKVFADAEIAELRESFMGLWPLGDGTSLSDEGERLVRDSGGGDGYVLKPQREGGGNNVYNKDIGPFLAELEESDRCVSCVHV